MSVACHWQRWRVPAVNCVLYWSNILSTKGCLTTTKQSVYSSLLKSTKLVFPLYNQSQNKRGRPKKRIISPIPNWVGGILLLPFSLLSEWESGHGGAPAPNRKAGKVDARLVHFLTCSRCLECTSCAGRHGRHDTDPPMNLQSTT